MAEATITINGATVSESEALTIRVALEAFALDLSTNGLGDDEHGADLAWSYLHWIAVLRKRMRIEVAESTGTMMGEGDA